MGENGLAAGERRIAQRACGSGAQIEFLELLDDPVGPWSINLAGGDRQAIGVAGAGDERDRGDIVLPDADNVPHLRLGTRLLERPLESPRPDGSRAIVGQNLYVVRGMSTLVEFMPGAAMIDELAHSQAVDGRPRWLRRRRRTARRGGSAAGSMGGLLDGVERSLVTDNPHGD